VTLRGRKIDQNDRAVALHPLLDELLRLSVDQRIALVETISAKGFEPGCWVEVDDADLVDVMSACEMSAELSLMPRLQVGEVAEFEGEHPWDPPTSGQSGWVIIGQVCDLSRDVRDEPLAQLALLREAEEDDDLPAWWRNSMRWIPLDPTGKASRHYVDLRIQAFLPKQVLATCTPRQAIPSDADFEKQRPRTRFALRVGQRHSRAGVPTSIVEQVVEPLGRAVTDSPLRKRLDASFSEWLLLPTEHGSDRHALLAITMHSSDSEEFRDAEDLFFREFWDGLRNELRDRLDPDASAVVALDDLLLIDWMSAWKLELDFLTYGSKGEPSSPEPQA
jgi:hypothetical protein